MIFKNYIADALRIAYGLNLRYADVSKPVKRRNPDEIVTEIMEKGGLSFERI